MIRVALAAEPTLGAGLTRAGLEVVALLRPEDVIAAATGRFSHDEVPEGWHGLQRADALIVPAQARVLTAEVVAWCDRAHLRIVALADDESSRRFADALGVVSVGTGDPTAVAAAAALPLVHTEQAVPRTAAGRVLAVWGPPGAPGRSTIAAALAAELGRGGRRVLLVDADAHAPSIALALGLADEGPGFAAACRQAENGTLTPAEIARIAQRVGEGDGGFDVLAGINRPARWPELSADRVASALEACRAAAELIVVDVAAAVESDEEIISDLEGPRRNAATLAVLRSADLVVVVGQADPVGAARLLRGIVDLRVVIGATPMRVLVNRLRGGALGVDARGQLRRALERYAGVEEVWFAPHDPRAADAALLRARSVSDAAPRSGLVAAVRRFAVEAVRALPAGADTPEAGRRRLRSAPRGADRPRARARARRRAEPRLGE